MENTGLVISVSFAQVEFIETISDWSDHPGNMMWKEMLGQKEHCFQGQREKGVGSVKEKQQ